jgi:hypothetical protein
MFSVGCDGDWPLDCEDILSQETDIPGFELLEILKNDANDLIARVLLARLEETFAGDREAICQFLLSPAGYLGNDLPAEYIFSREYHRVISTIDSMDADQFV